MNNFIKTKKSKKLVLIQILVLIVIHIILYLFMSIAGVNFRTSFMEDLLYLIFAVAFMFTPILLLLLSFIQFKKHTHKIISWIHVIIAAIQLASVLLLVPVVVVGNVFFFVILAILDALFMVFIGLIYLFDSINLSFDESYDISKYTKKLWGKVYTERYRKAFNKIWNKIVTEKTQSFLKDKWKKPKYRRSIIGAVVLFFLIAVFSGIGGDSSSSQSSSSGNSREAALWNQLPKRAILDMDYQLNNQFEYGFELLSLRSVKDLGGGYYMVSVKVKVHDNIFSMPLSLDSN